MANQLKEYLRDPFLNQLYQAIKQVGPLKSILIDLTHVCNIRCQGCYFFAEEMDKNKAPREEAEFDAFIAREKSRGTNFISVAGGEPSLMLGRLKKIYDNFRMIVVTNGLRQIPYEGFEQMPVAISVWGDHATDTRLRGGGKLDIFARALQNYKDDPRAIWYFTTTPGNAYEIEPVVEQCVANGNRLFFSYYGDVSGMGGELDHRHGFAPVRHEINRMIARYPDRILFTAYASQVISTGQLYDETWGYEVCCNLSVDNPINAERFKNGKPYNTHFNAYNPDLKTTRRCCVGETLDCSTCFNVWTHLGWIMINMKRHLGSKQEFTNWLTTTYLFYLITHLVDFETGVKWLPEIQQRVSLGQNIPESVNNFNLYLPLQSALTVPQTSWKVPIDN